MTDDGTTTLAGPPPGWYTDPRGAQRWWDGQTWTDHVAAQPAPEGLAQQGVQPPVASTQEQVAPVVPLVAPAPLSPGRSQNLLPAAPPPQQSSRRSLSLPKLPPLVWGGAAAALVAILAGAFYFTRSGDDAPVAASPVAHAPVLPAKSAALLSAKQATAALPPVSVLGAGWTLDASKSIDLTRDLTHVDPVSTPAACGKILDRVGPGKALGSPVVAVSRSFTSNVAKTVVGVGVVSYKNAPPASVVTAASSLLPGCKTFTMGSKVTVSSVAFPAIGQGAVDITMLVPYKTANLTTRTAVVRAGHNLVLVQSVGVGGAFTPGDVLALASATLARLPH